MNGETTGQVLRARLLLDMSGSMAPRKDDTLKAVNEYVASLRESAPEMLLALDAFTSTIQDRQDFRELVPMVPIREIIALDGGSYLPGGNTPLYDAIAWSVDKLASDFARRPVMPRNGEPPRRVVMPEGSREGPAGEAGLLIIQTDGQENASRDWTKKRIVDLLKGKQADGWEFVYLGCDLDAMGCGADIGIQAANTLAYDDRSVGRAYKGLAASTVRFARSASMGVRLSANTAFEKPLDLRQRSGLGDPRRPQTYRRR